MKYKEICIYCMLWWNYFFRAFFGHFLDRQTDRPTDRQTDRQTDRPTDRQTFIGKLYFQKGYPYYSVGLKHVNALKWIKMSEWQYQAKSEDAINTIWISQQIYKS